MINNSIVGASPCGRPILNTTDRRRGLSLRLISLYTKLLVVVTFLLIIAGGLVTSTKSGLSVPDWPLSYGKLMPPMVGGIRYEHTHRMIASLVGFMTFILAIWVGFSESRKWVRWTTIAALGAVVAQGILGGLTVLYLLPAPISIFHACLAQTFFTLTVCLAFFTSREWLGRGAPLWAPGFRPDGQAQGPAPIELKKPLLVMIALIYTQLILGATVRHTANHYILISHIISGFLVLIHALIVMNRVVKNHEGEKKLIVPSIGLGLITLFQTTLGMGSFIYTVVLRQTVQPQLQKIFFVTAHQSLGALLLATSIFLYLRIMRIEK